MDDKKSSLKLISIFILSGLTLIIVSGLIGYFLARKQISVQSKNQLTPTAFILPTSTQTLTSSGTEGWKTCTNLSYDFTIKYPANFEIDTLTCDYNIMDYNLVKDINVMNSIDNFRKNWLLTIKVERSNLDLNQWLKNKELCPSSFESCSEIETGVFDNSIQFDEINRNYSGSETIIENNGSIYQISLSARNPNISVKNVKEIYKQILSTFKFAENGITSQNAVEIVNGLSEVKSFFSTIQNARISADTSQSDNKFWVIHVYESFPDHNATFNWYKVNKTTGEYSVYN
ncbi:MAG: hypothetical protein AAB441_04380 [Patescibacteria group bacterium]